MGFVTSFLIICFAGFWSYHLYHKFGLAKGRKAWLAYYAIFIVGGLMLLDFLIYMGVLDFVFPILNQLAWIEIDNGKDFMWNSFQLLGVEWGIDYEDSGLNFIAIMLILSYPMWFKFWSNGSRILFGGNKHYQVGLWYLIQPTKKPKADIKVAKVPQKT